MARFTRLIPIPKVNARAPWALLVLEFGPSKLAVLAGFLKWLNILHASFENRMLLIVSLEGRPGLLG